MLWAHNSIVESLVTRRLALFRAAGLIPFLALLACPSAYAEGAGLRFSGFGTFGVLHESGDGGIRFRRDIGQSVVDNDVRAEVDTRLGLQVNWQPAPQWELVSQAVLKRRAHTSHNQDALVWAFVAWRPNADWAVRVGRTSPDMFLLSDYRDVGFAYPWIRPSVEFYGWLPLWGMDGIDVARTWNSDNVQWRGKFFIGQASSTVAGTSGPQSPDLRIVGDYLVGTTWTRESDGLTLKFSLAKGKNHPGGDTSQVDMVRSGLEAVRALPVPQVSAEADRLLHTFPSTSIINTYGALSAAWEVGAWTLQGEIGRINGNFENGRRRFGYASAAYRQGAFTFYGMAGAVRMASEAAPIPQWDVILSPVIGPVAAGGLQQLGQAVAFDYNAGRQHQRTFTGGLRWDVTPRTALKLQWDHVNVSANGAGFWSGSGLVRESRHIDVLGASLDFVF